MEDKKKWFFLTYSCFVSWYIVKTLSTLLPQLELRSM